MEGVSTSLIQSGAPPSFWGEAMAHLTFTRNTIPRHEVENTQKNARKMHTNNKQQKEIKEFRSSDNILEGNNKPFSLKHLVAFGTQTTVFLTPEQRKEQKTPGQTKSFDGVVVGYADGMRGYRVWVKSKKN